MLNAHLFLYVLCTKYSDIFRSRLGALPDNQQIQQTAGDIIERKAVMAAETP